MSRNCLAAILRQFYYKSSSFIDGNYCRDRIFRAVFEFTLWYWIAFGGLVIFLLALDLLVFHRTDHEQSLAESAGWTVFWIALALIFNAVLWWWGYRVDRPELGINFFTGYLIEKSLSMDNIFVFVVIFRYFKIPLMYQYRVLFWGILGAIVMRLVFILAGVTLIHYFDWVMVVFGVFLIYTAYKLARHSNEDVDPAKNPVLRIARRCLPVTGGDHHEHGHSFFIRENGKLLVTPMFLILLVIESTDVVFAVDSIPAVLAITTEPFIVFSSNIFAILGLRALYFLLAGVIDMFCYLHYGLAAVLGFVGVKMLLEYWELFHFSPWLSLGIIASLLSISIIASIWTARHTKKEID
jgi:TerC family integral membrane protein